jgi:hypothetical protein
MPCSANLCSAMKLVTRFFLGCSLLLTAWILTGCATTDSTDNEASRPWNTPRQWETGLPGFTNDRR